MSVQRIASRYAKTLIELAVDQDKLEIVLRDVQAFQRATKNRDFLLFIKSPIVHTAKKKVVFDKLFLDKYDKLTMAFLQILADKGREAYLPEIAVEFISNYKKIKHISTVRVTTATKLSDATIKHIHDSLTASDATDNNVEIIAEVDPDVIGGFILEFGDKIYDATVAHKLALLKKEFAENLYISQVVAK